MIYPMRADSLKRGFTLIELIVVIALGAIVILILVGILSNNTNFFYKETNIINEGLSITGVADMVNSYARQSSSVATVYPTLSPQYSTDQDTLILMIPSTSDTGTISNTYDYIVIEQDADNNNVLRMRIFPDPLSIRNSENRVLTTFMQTIRYSYLNNAGVEVAPAQASQIDVSITVLSKMGSSQSSRTLTTRIFLRNS